MAGDLAGDDMTTNGILPAFPLARLDGVILDMDGVVTRTAMVHFAAWKQLFDTFLAERHAAGAASGAAPVDDRPFDEDDYRLFVDGKPRDAGVRDFLASRGIHLPEGQPDDAPDVETVAGLGNRKNAVFLARVVSDGVESFPGTVEFLSRLTAAGRPLAVISASENATRILRAAGVLDRFDVKVDGTDARRMRFPGKPDPAIFLEAARRLGTEPDRTAVVEDAIAGVEAGVRGGFGFVLGIDRTGYREELEAAGASLVVSDLAELLTPAPG
jgi:beta-phosphoglucomutase family hydrolase